MRLNHVTPVSWDHELPYPPKPVKTTAYFREQVLRKRSYLQLGWLEQVISNPERRSVQGDGRIRFWGWVPELGRWLRVVTLEDGETVHNAFPDRDFDPRQGP